MYNLLQDYLQDFYASSNKQNIHLSGYDQIGTTIFCKFLCNIKGEASSTEELSVEYGDILVWLYEIKLNK